MTTKYIVNNLQNQVIEGGISALTISADTIVISGSPIPQPSYKVYTALLIQNSTNDPFALVLENTIGPIVWTRSSTGVYLGTLSGAFTSQKTIVFMSVSSSGGASWGYQYVSARQTDDEIFVISQIGDSTSTLSDGILNSTPIEMRVFI
jgi:hypothetical protein